MNSILANPIPVGLSPDQVQPIKLKDLHPGDIVEYINPVSSMFAVGTFVRSINRRTGDKRTDIIVLNSLGHKTIIRDENIRWDRTAHYMRGSI